MSRIARRVIVRAFYPFTHAHACEEFSLDGLVDLSTHGAKVTGAGATAYAAQLEIQGGAGSSVWTMVQGSVQQMRWLPAVVVGSALGEALALGLAYYGKTFYQYGPDPYVPRDEERLMYEARQDAVKRAKRDDVVIPP